MQPEKGSPGAVGRIPHGFSLRPVASEDDALRYAELNQAVAREGEIALRLIRHRPDGDRGDFVMAVEDASGRVVSTTCLLRWHLSLQGVKLRAAMLEMVVTDPAFRRHGLVREQIDAFHDRARADGADLCIIQGIPYYYRQFGYGYALDHFRQVSIAAPRVAEAAPAGTLVLRPCSRADVPVLQALHDLAMSRQGMAVLRAARDWDYLLTRAGRSVDVVEKAGHGIPVGYVTRGDDGAHVAVAESALRDPADAPALLALLAGGRTGTVVIGGNRADPLYRTAENLGGRAETTGQWLVRFPDPVGFLARLTPVLNSRLGRAGLSGVDTEIIVNLYRSAIRMRLTGGRVASVEDAGFIDSSIGSSGGDLCIPPEAFARIVLGCRDLDQLRDAWPDIEVRPASRPLIEVLFPRFESLVLMPY